MIQKRFINIVLIVLAVMLAGTVGYFALVRKPSSVIQPINTPTITQPQIVETPTSTKNEVSSTSSSPSIKSVVVLPSTAIQGYKKQSGPSVPAGELDVSEDCKAGVLTGNDEGYCAVSQADERWEKGAGVVEIYFEVPPDIDAKSIRETTINLNLICSSGVGLYSLTEFSQWARFGRDLPSQAYKPDGSYGYLSCLYGAAERKSVSLPIEVHDSKAGIRIVKEEATAFAFIDEATLKVVYFVVR